MSRATGGLPGSICHTTPSPCAVAHTWPAPTATAERFWALTGIFRPTRLVLGSMRVTARVSSALMNHTPSLPAAMVAASTTILATRFAGVWIDPRDRPVAVDRPDGARAD